MPFYNNNKNNSNNNNNKAQYDVNKYNYNNT